jgi:Protein phosphatase 2C
MMHPHGGCSGGQWDKQDVKDALIRTFSAMDGEILADAARSGARCGSTACVALQLGANLYVAHAGVWIEAPDSGHPMHAVFIPRVHATRCRVPGPCGRLVFCVKVPLNAAGWRARTDSRGFSCLTTAPAVHLQETALPCWTATDRLRS